MHPSLPTSAPNVPISMHASDNTHELVHTGNTYPSAFKKSDCTSYQTPLYYRSEFTQTESISTGTLLQKHSNGDTHPSDLLSILYRQMEQSALNNITMSRKTLSSNVGACTLVMCANALSRFDVRRQILSCKEKEQLQYRFTLKVLFTNKLIVITLLIIFFTVEWLSRISSKTCY